MKTYIFVSIVLLLVMINSPAFAIYATAEDKSSEETVPAIVLRAQEKSRAKDWKEASALWTQVVESNPVNGQYWDQLGHALYSAKKYSLAIPAYEKALEFGSGFPFNAAYNTACCYSLLGDKEHALEWLTRSMDMGFRDLHQVQVDDDLKSLHGDSRFTKLAAIADVHKMSRDEGWRYDLWLLARETMRIHYKPMRAVSDREMDVFVKKLSEEIPRLTDNQIAVEFMKLVSMYGDAHTTIRPGANVHAAGGPPSQPEALLLQFYLFKEGLYITLAAPTYSDLAGAQVVKIGGHSVDDVLAAMDPVISRDNAIWPKFMGPRFMRFPRMLNGLGLIPDSDKVSLTIRDAKGERNVTVPSVVGDPGDDWVSADHNSPGPEPLYLKNRKSPYWFEYLPDTKTVYFQYNAVQDDPKEPLSQFCDRLFHFITDSAAEKLIIDMRWNGGGNNFLNAPLLESLIRCDRINRKGNLFVIVGRNTFSAAMCGATQIERYTNAIFVGEPTGSRPNFVGESIPLTLPYSKMQATISDLYWQNSVAMDYRTWIAPVSYAPPSFELYRAKRDPAMEAISSFPN